MPAITPLSDLFKLNDSVLNKKERFILEAFLFKKIYQKLQQDCRDQYENYFRLVKLTKEQQEAMINNQLMQFILKEVLSNDNYTPEGLAHYTDTSIEIVLEICRGRYINPPSNFFYRLIELHYTLYREVYLEVLNKLR